MKSLFLKFVVCFLILAVLSLIIQNYPLMAQPQMGQSQRAQANPEDPLLSFSFPPGPITANDMPQIVSVIQQVVNKVSDSIRAQQRSASGTDVRSIMSGVLLLKDWLSLQKCVQQVVVPFVESPDKYSEAVFLTYPGQVPVNITFKMEDKKTVDYRLLLFVSTADSIKFASFNENKEIKTN